MGFSAKLHPLHRCYFPALRLFRLSPTFLLSGVAAYYSTRTYSSSYGLLSYAGPTHLTLSAVGLCLISPLLAFTFISTRLSGLPLFILFYILRASLLRYAFALRLFYYGSTRAYILINLLELIFLLIYSHAF